MSIKSGRSLKHKFTSWKHCLENSPIAAAPTTITPTTTAAAAAATTLLVIIIIIIIIISRVRCFVTNNDGFWIG
jgi:hypothetical protein